MDDISQNNQSNESGNPWGTTEDLWGKLAPLVDDDDITDINCNSHAIWLDNVKTGRYEAKDISLNSEELENLAYRIANINNDQFNTVNPILEAELPALRLQFVHSSIATSGTSLSLRKTPMTSRIKAENLEKDGYCTNICLDFLQKSVKTQLNMVVCGMTGAGKTEFAKFLSGYINPWERIITIEDTLELHLNAIYPDKDIVEMKVNEIVDYNGAIKSCMRMKPTWILLSEARGYEVKELIKSISTGAKIITTLHTDDARSIPKRILNMFEDNELSNDKIENMIFDYIDLGVHIQCDFNEGETHRYIDQLVIFYLDDQFKQHTDLIYSVVNGKVFYKPLPECILDKFEKMGLEVQWGA